MGFVTTPRPYGATNGAPVGRGWSAALRQGRAHHDTADATTSAGAPERPSAGGADRASAGGGQGAGAYHARGGRGPPPSALCRSSCACAASAGADDRLGGRRAWPRSPRRPRRPRVRVHEGGRGPRCRRRCGAARGSPARPARLRLLRFRFRVRFRFGSAWPCFPAPVAGSVPPWPGSPRTVSSRVAAEVTDSPRQFRHATVRGGRPGEGSEGGAAVCVVRRAQRQRERVTVPVPRDPVACPRRRNTCRPGARTGAGTRG